MGILSNPIINWLNKTQAAREFPLSDFERICFELKPCDVLLVEGRSHVSDVIKVITRSPWSHAALYIGKLHDIEDEELQTIVRQHYQGDNNKRLVIESLLGQGTVVRELESYRQEHLRICRPSRLSFRDSQQVVRYAVSRLGVEYDVRQIFDLARFLFPWVILPRRWRSSLFRHNAGPTTRTVCSTMIAEAFSFVDFPILPLIKRTEAESDQASSVQLFRRNPRLCTPSDFDYSPYFEIIKYPFVDFHVTEDYHLLPWHGTAELSAEESDIYTSGKRPDAAEVDQAIKDAAAAPSRDDEPAGGLA